MRLFIFGVGYCGRALAGEAIAAGAAVSGTTRAAEKLGALAGEGIDIHLFDGVSLSPEAAAALRDTTHLVISIAPGESGDPVLAAARAIIADRMPALRWIGYLSTVGVYGDHRGGWVDEDSQSRPVSRRSIRRAEAEQAWLDVGAAIGKPVAILRLSGIYGPGRNAFVNLANGTARRIVKADQMFNRIHVDDIAGAVILLAGRDAGGIFNITDDEPAPLQDVVTYAAALAGLEPPPEIAFETADMTPMARSFYGENKRVSNAKIKAAGYRFRHPNYRAALERMWKLDLWRGSNGAQLRS